MILGCHLSCPVPVHWSGHIGCKHVVVWTPGQGERNEKPGSAVRPDAQRRKANCINRTTVPTLLPVCSRQVKQRCTVSFCNESPSVFTQKDKFSTWIVQFVPFMLCSLLSLPNGTYWSWWQHGVIITPGTSIKQLDVRKSQCCWLLIELS